MALQNSSIDTMGTFLGKTFYIPTYQREYSWEEGELEDFWEDLRLTVEDHDGSIHFLGQIVVHSDETADKKYIIDGQQRTITSVIFLKSLHTLFEKMYIDGKCKDADYRRQDIEIKYIGRSDELHLHLGQADGDYFKENIQLNVPNIGKESKKSKDRIRFAYFFFENKLSSLIENVSDIDSKYSVLFSYYKTFIDKFNVLYMEATKLDESFIIFETLNARGKELETADLLKNYLYSHSKSNIEITQKNWDSMITKLDNVDPTKFIRHFWNSRNEHTREKQLYKTISKSISSPKDAKILLNDLEHLAEYYKDLVSPSDCTAFTDYQLIQSLKSLDTLKAKSFYPVVLAMLQRDCFSENEIAIVLNEIESYIFRNFTICGNVANRAEMFFAKLARDIYGEALSNADEICAEIKPAKKSQLLFLSRFPLFFASQTGRHSRPQNCIMLFYEYTSLTLA